MLNLREMTHGTEHELADWNAEDLLRPAFNLSRDSKDITIVNSSGIANDPSLKLHKLGGEINTPPTDTIEGQCEVLYEILQRWPEATINYRSNLHWHIRVPGLSEDLYMLQRLARYNAHWLPIVLPLIEPIAPCTPFRNWQRGDLALKGFNRRQRRRRVSHQTILPISRLDGQLAACTVEEFHRAEVPKTKDGQPMPHAQPRAAVNVRQLLQTDTIEFRHFPGTLSLTRLYAAGSWCRCYIECALSDWGLPEDRNPMVYYTALGHQIGLLPVFRTYDHKLEIRYRATCHDNTLPREVIAANIAAIEAGTFDDEAWEAKFKW